MLCMLLFLGMISMAFADTLPEGLEEISSHGTKKLFYLEDDDRIEIYSCSVISLEKENNEAAQENAETDDDSTSDSDEEFNADFDDSLEIMSVIDNPSQENNFRRNESKENEADVLISGNVVDSSTIDKNDISNEALLDSGCNAEWFCSKWKDCFKDEIECLRLARDNDCNYNKLYSHVLDCDNDDDNSTRVSGAVTTDTLEPKKRFSWKLLLLAGGIPIIALFGVERYMRYKESIQKKAQEDKKIEEIKRKYSEF